MKRLSLAAVAAVMTCACAPTDAPAPSDPMTATPSLNPVLMPVPADPTVSFSVSFAVGSQDDPPGKEGLAYLTGRMIADAGTKVDSLETILEKLYPLASDYDMHVDREVSTLTGRTHRDNLGAYVPLFRNSYTQPGFSQSDFERVQSETINFLSNTLRYESDEELAKAALYQFVFEGTPYAHPSEGTVAGLRAITLADVRDFFTAHYTRATARIGLAGGFPQDLLDQLQLESTPTAQAATRPQIDPPRSAGRRVVLIDKPGADASISFGFPLSVRRGERDFYALWIANSWLGEHRNQASHLFQVIREVRGLNYGDYSYIEAFPDGGELQMPPVNVSRNHQIFQVWIRTLPNEQAVFALRAALRELERLIDDGMTQESFELTRAFLKKYALQFADTTSGRLGYAMDDRFYGIDGDGHLARFRAMMDDLTLEEVNSAIRRHLQTEDLKIAIVTGDAPGLRAVLQADAPTPISYATAKPDDVLQEDVEISGYPLDIAENGIRLWQIDAMFAESASPPDIR